MISDAESVTYEDLASFPAGGDAVVIGATGGLGTAVATHLLRSDTFNAVHRFARGTSRPLDLGEEASIAAAAQWLKDSGRDLRLVVDCTGFLHGRGFMPEKSWRQIDPAHMAHAFAVNAIGPALLMKHFLPLLPREGKSVFATLSAKVGSIADNSYGGWYSYRASKAALNQLVHTAAIELTRKRREAICVALHPGTVATDLSEPFSKDGLTVRQPDAAAARLLRVIDGLTPEQTGGFFSHDGMPLPW
ncbi:SDR family NAD(P)-dependent oxidoreductase [Ferruginivarius sediminum]|uniref:SDR family NAD(P)-dependent oxidoreductase n=2 Tax=Ferruginivarius sediminum TaxID=2661937 RepID=A0A369TC96_9PROT|nr:SDR family NAD(P)-dependent oxidoreductase [Ferruginivarius sediminum]